MFEFKATGKTINDAITNGLNVLKIEKDKVSVRVLKQAKGLNNAEVLISIEDEEVEKNENIKKLQNLTIIDNQIKETENFLSKNIKENNDLMTSLLAKISSKTKDEISQEEITALTKEFVLGILHIAGYKNIEVLAEENDEHISLSFSANGLGKLIGFKGKTLASLQFLTNIFATSISRKTKHFIIDLNSYKKQRTEKLTEKAINLAKQILENGEEICLEPMNAFERRVIHNEISKFTELQTESVGEEPNRHIVIRKK